MRSFICLLASCCAVVMPTVGFAPKVTPKERARAAALKMIPPDASVALIAHPRSTLTSPTMETAPREIISAYGKQQFGFDPMEIELLVAAVEIRGPGDAAGAIAMKFRKPISIQDLAPRLTRGTQTGELKGKPYLKRDGGAGFYMPSDTVLVIGTDDMIRKMIRREGKPTGGVHRHLAAGEASDVQLVAAIAPVRAMLGAQLDQIPLPGGLAGLKQLPEHTEAVGVRLGASPLSGTIAFHANDDAAAEKMEAIFKRAIGAGTMMANAFTAQNMSDDSELTRATVAYSKRMIDRLARMLQPKRDGTKLTLGGEFNNQSETAAIAGITALLMPAVQAAQRSSAINKAKQIMLALLNHESAYGRLPAQAICDDEEKPLLSWRVSILPFIEEQQLYNEFHLDEPWDSEHNKKLIARMPEVFAHAGEDRRDGKTHFLGVSGDDSRMFEKGEPTGRGIATITDGTSRSIAVVEADRSVIWTKPDDFEVDPDNPLKGLGNFRANGTFLAIFCDGSVQRFNKDLDEDTLNAYLTVNGGEAVDRARR